MPSKNEKPTKSSKNTTPKKMRKHKKGGDLPTATGVIITSGDCSDFDGFLAIPLYYKAAVAHKMDIAFVMNYPSFLDETPGFNFTLADLQKGDIPVDVSVSSNGMNFEIKKEIPGTPSNIVIGGLEAGGKVSNKTGRVISEDTIGYGYKYDLDVWLAAKRALPTDPVNSPSGPGSPITFALIEAVRKLGDNENLRDNEKLREIYLDNNNNRISDESIINKRIIKFILTYISQYILDEIFHWCKTTYSQNDSDYKPTLHFCTGGINKRNMFSAIAVKNELEVYGSPLLEIFNLANNIVTDRFQDTYLGQLQKQQQEKVKNFNSKIDNWKPILNFVNEIKNNNNYKIYIDMNGSVAWYTQAVSKNINKEAVQGVFIEGGVLSYSQVDTLGSSPFLDRIACATINNLFDSESATLLCNDFSNKLHFVSNNEINTNFNLTPAFLSLNPKVPTAEAYKKAVQLTKDMGLIPNDEYMNKNTTNKVVNCFENFYFPRANDRKFFDVTSAFLLVQFIENNLQSTPTSTFTANILNYLSIPAFGITILSTKDTPLDILQEYITFGMANKISGTPNDIIDINNKNLLSIINDTYPLPFMHKCLILEELLFSNPTIDKNKITLNDYKCNYSIQPVNVYFSKEDQPTIGIPLYYNMVKKYMDTPQRITNAFTSPDLANLSVKQIKEENRMYPPVASILKQQSSEGGGKNKKRSSPQCTKTDQKIKYGNRMCVLYLGKRNGKYVKVKGEFVKVK